jgi:magnesium chelatase family protein
MLSERLHTILPELTFEESLEITKIQSVAGILPDDVSLVRNRPYRAPHHKASLVSLIGGGQNPKPGEISLAHCGVLFFDELPEFPRASLESLRGPLEDSKITISRTNSTVTYPCDFIFIASMNPCPCGYLNDKKKTCVCTPTQISNYQNKISGPILDRIDLHVEVERVDYKKLQSKEKPETSEEIRKRVNSARNVQIKRYEKEGIISNSQLSAAQIEKYCKLDEETKIFLENAFNVYGYSARTYSRILKIARTIADLDKKENIELTHVAEAIQYRTLDRSNANE